MNKIFNCFVFKASGYLQASVQRQVWLTWISPLVQSSSLNWSNFNNGWEQNTITEKNVYRNHHFYAVIQEIFESFKLLTFNQLNLNAKLDVLTLFWLLFAFHYTSSSTKGSLLNCTVSCQYNDAIHWTLNIKTSYICLYSSVLHLGCYMCYISSFFSSQHVSKFTSSLTVKSQQAEVL